MKQFLLFLLCLFFLVAAKAQSNYAEAIQQGDDAFNKGQYKIAINKYFAAEAFDPSKKEIVKGKVNKVFDKIEKLRNEAHLAEAKAFIEKNNAEKAKIESDSAKNKAIRSAEETKNALAKANKLISAFYFYDNKFAVAQVGDLLKTFFFIDTNGNKVIKLGDWTRAEPFEETGFARVQGSKGNKVQYFLLDTLGNTYNLSSDLTVLNKEHAALELFANFRDTLPDEMFNQTQLQILMIYNDFAKPDNFKVLNKRIANLQNLRVLYLSGCSIDSLSAHIKALKNLTYLNLYYNKLKSLPAYISELKNLKILDVRLNHLSGLPPEIVNLRKLEELNLTLNQLSELPGEIGELKNLKYLKLGNNQLKSLPPGIGLLENLVKLDLRFNLLTNLPDQISQLKNLRVLKLDGNLISEVEQEKIKKLLPDCQIEF